jgi:hypothetical protein
MKPQDKVRIGMYLLLGVLGIVVINNIEWIANTLQNIVIAGVCGFIATFLAWDVISGKNRVWTLLEFILSKIMGFVITLDPIAIAKIDLNSLFKRKERIKDEGIATTRQIQGKIKDSLTKESDNYDKAKRTSETSNDKTDVILAKKKMEMIEKFLEKYKQQFEKAKFLEGRLTDIYKALGFLHEYKTTELEYVEKDYLLSKSVKAALQVAWIIAYIVDSARNNQ